MARHKRFCDGAGFTQHCWECKHATKWHKVNTIDGHEANCEVYGIKIGKFDSPNNGCSKARDCYDYESEV